MMNFKIDATDPKDQVFVVKAYPALVRDDESYHIPRPLLPEWDYRQIAGH
jgi:hypothetical protein